jgi:hypothetical protein
MMRVEVCPEAGPAIGSSASRWPIRRFGCRYSQSSTEFRCSAPQCDGKSPQKVQESGGCRLCMPQSAPPHNGTRRANGTNHAGQERCPILVGQKQNGVERVEIRHESWGGRIRNFFTAARARRIVFRRWSPLERRSQRQLHRRGGPPRRYRLLRGNNRWLCGLKP